MPRLAKLHRLVPARRPLHCALPCVARVLDTASMAEKSIGTALPETPGHSGTRHSCSTGFITFDCQAARVQPVLTRPTGTAMLVFAILNRLPRRNSAHSVTQPHAHAHAPLGQLEPTPRLVRLASWPACFAQVPSRTHFCSLSPLSRATKARDVALPRRSASEACLSRVRRACPRRTPPFFLGARSHRWLYRLRGRP